MRQFTIYTNQIKYILTLNKMNIMHLRVLRNEIMVTVGYGFL